MLVRFKLPGNSSALANTDKWRSGGVRWVRCWWGLGKHTEALYQYLCVLTCKIYSADIIKCHSMKEFGGGLFLADCWDLSSQSGAATVECAQALDGLTRLRLLLVAQRSAPVVL